MNTIEEKLWNYIDGTCTPDDQEAISRLIASDEVYRNKYEELLALNLDFTHLELEEPSMAFTYNVMEAVRTEAASVPLKSAINKNVIRGLVGVFVFIITAVIVYGLFSINWSAGSTAGVFKMPQIKLPELSNALKSGMFKAFVFFDIVLILYFGDAYLRKLRTAKEL